MVPCRPPMTTPPSRRTRAPRTGRGEAVAQRWALIRDLASFTLKTAIEALRDLVLIPLALVAGVLGLLFSPDDPRRYFREVLDAGRRFDAWLDLFGERSGSEAGGGERPAGLDVLLGRVERAVVEQHRRGGVTAQAKEAIDRALDVLQRAPQHAGGTGGDGARRGPPRSERSAAPDRNP